MLDTHLINVALESLSVAVGVAILIAVAFVGIAAARLHRRTHPRTIVSVRPMTAQSASTPVRTPVVREHQAA